MPYLQHPPKGPPQRTPRCHKHTRRAHTANKAGVVQNRCVFVVSNKVHSQFCAPTTASFFVSFVANISASISASTSISASACINASTSVSANVAEFHVAVIALHLAAICCDTRAALLAPRAHCVVATSAFVPRQPLRVTGKFAFRSAAVMCWRAVGHS